MPGLPYQTMLDGAFMGEFWGYVKYFLFFIAPVVMIWVAVQLVGRFVGVVRNSVEDDEEYVRRRRYDDDEDYY